MSSSNRNLPLRPELVDIEPYGAPQLEVPVRLNVNENPYSPSLEMITDICQEVAKAVKNLNRYSDRDHWELRAELAKYLQKESGVSFDKAQIWAANGSNEVMSQLLGAYAGPQRIVMSTEYSYSMYPEYARNAHSEYVAIPRKDLFYFDLEGVERAMSKHRPAVFMLANPNNPTGTVLGVEEQKHLLTHAQTTGPNGTQTVVIIDEAYGEFRPAGVPSALEWVDEYPNLVVTRTMSKSFGMAGLRIGYLVASPEVIADIMRVRLPYHLSGVSQAAARAALRHSDVQLQQLAELRTRRDELAKWLIEEGYTVPESHANFVLFGPFNHRHQVFSDLLARGVLIREVGPEGYLRVSVGTASEDARFRSALKAVTSA